MSEIASQYTQSQFKVKKRRTEIAGALIGNDTPIKKVTQGRTAAVT